MCGVAPLSAAVHALLAFPFLASSVRNDLQLQPQLDKVACGWPNCGQVGEYCCSEDGDEEGTLSSGSKCEEAAMLYASGCAPCEDNSCGRCTAPEGGLHCGSEGELCCGMAEGDVSGFVIPGESCSEMGMTCVETCKHQETSLDSFVDPSNQYVTHEVFDGGNCMFDALARDLSSQLFDKPEEDEEVAAKAQELRIQAANLLLNETEYRRDFLQSLRAVYNWGDTVQKWLKGRNVTDRQSFTDHNDEELKAWIELVWADPPMQDGKLQGGVELYGDRLILKILGKALGVKIQVLSADFMGDGGPVGDMSSDAGLLYVRQVGQHYEAVRAKDDADDLMAKMGYSITLAQAKMAMEHVKQEMGAAAEPFILLGMACQYLVENQTTEEVDCFDD